MWAYTPWPVALTAPRGASRKGVRLKLAVVRRIGAGQDGPNPYSVSDCSSSQLVWGRSLISAHSQTLPDHGDMEPGRAATLTIFECP